MVNLVKITNWIRKNILKNFDNNTTFKLSNGTSVNPVHVSNSLNCNGSSRAIIKNTMSSGLNSPEIAIDATSFPIIWADTSSNTRIINMHIDYTQNPWRLVIVVVIDGIAYTKYANLE